MAKASSPDKVLESAIADLQRRRKVHLDELARIDGIFQKFGIRPDDGSRPVRRGPGRPPKSATAGAAPRGRRRRGRRSFPTSGVESILSFVKKAGAKGATTAEINRHWAAETRSGRADVTLGKLVSEKKLKREKIKGERGSRFRVA